MRYFIARELKFDTKNLRIHTFPYNIYGIKNCMNIAHK